MSAVSDVLQNAALPSSLRQACITCLQALPHLKDNVGSSVQIIFC